MDTARWADFFNYWEAHESDVLIRRVQGERPGDNSIWPLVSLGAFVPGFDEGSLAGPLRHGAVEGDCLKLDGLACSTRNPVLEANHFFRGIRRANVVALRRGSLVLLRLAISKPLAVLTPALSPGSFPQLPTYTSAAAGSERRRTHGLMIESADNR